MSVTRPVGQERRIGTPLRGYHSHCATLAGSSRSRSHGRLRRPQSSRRDAPRCETAKAGKVSFQRRHLAQGKPLEGRQSQVSGQGPPIIMRLCSQKHESMLVFLGKAIIYADRNICDALRDKRLKFGIRTIYRVFVSSETILCIF